MIDWSNAVSSGTDRGFTGHEHLDDLGLIHMNGRIYDPALGRFLSVDPHVAAAFDLQNYDRYAYVLNNPLASTDPTGFDSCDDACRRRTPADATLPPVVITGSNWREEAHTRGLFTTSDILRAAGFSAHGQGGPRMGPFIALGAAPGTPAQQSGGGLIVATKEQLESVARGAKNVAGILGKRVADNEAAPVLARLVGAMMAEAPGEEAAGEGLATDGATAPAESGSEDSNEEGCIYCVKGNKTSSGKDYVGSTDNMGNRQRDKSDGRDREGAEVVDTYPKEDRNARRTKEQQAINGKGGVDKLDNKRNEVAPKKWSSMGINPP